MLGIVLTLGATLVLLCFAFGAGDDSPMREQFLDSIRRPGR